MKRICCIVVTYNGRQWIERCLTSLINSIAECTIICIDNCSTDGSADFIRNNFPQVLLIESPNNKGFGQANNIGLKLALAALADHVFLLNQDASVEPDTIEKLVQAQTAQPQFGIISPVHLNGGGTRLDLYFSRYLAASEIPEKLEQGLLAKEKNDLLINTPFVNAAAWLISSDCLKKTGGFDPIFFHYGEDNNYMQRAKYAGYQTGIYLGCHIFHDREMQLADTATTPEKKLKKEWVFFLTNACDINRKNAFTFVLKRFIRHSTLSIKELILFDRGAFLFNFGMAKNILLSAKAIAKSRAAAKRKSQTAFL